MCMTFTSHRSLFLSCLCLMALGVAPACNRAKNDEVPRGDDNSDKVAIAQLPDPGACPAACDNVLDLAKVELREMLAAPGISADFAKKRKDQTAATKDSDRATCIEKCRKGELKAACALKASSLAELASCRPARIAATSADGVAVLQPALAACDVLETSTDESSCVDLSTQLSIINQALRQTKGAHMNSELDHCTDVIFESIEPQCKDDSSFAAAFKVFTMSMLAQ